jgi:hypothetical protein
VWLIARNASPAGLACRLASNQAIRVHIESYDSTSLLNHDIAPLKVDCFMLHYLDARRGRLLTNSPVTRRHPELSFTLELAHSMRVHPSDSLSLQSGKSPLHRSSPAGFLSRWFSLQVPSPDIRTPGHASRRVHKTTFPQPTVEAGNVIEKLSSRGLGHFHHRSNVRSTNDTKSASSVGKG